MGFMNVLDDIPTAIAKHIPIKAVILQEGIAVKARDLCKDLGKVVLVCDENTKDFVNLGAEKIILPAKQKAELSKAKELAKLQADYFIAVGSGSLNDIVKYAAHLAGKPYIVFATALSMNGYVSPNASLLEAGYKKSFAAKAPERAYLDLEILRNAPKRLTNSGIGDSICRTTAQADVLLSSQVKDTPDYAELFALLKSEEEAIFGDMTALAKTLIYGGLAMLLAKSSAPASQGEHILAHYMELMQPQARESFHGEQIAVTTLTMATMQEKLLREKDYVDVEKIDEQKIIKHFGAEFGKYCLQQTHSKYEGLRKVKIDKRAIEANMKSAEIIRGKLAEIDAPLAPADIGWDGEIYDNAAIFARYTRDRFTFLDLQ